jgi:hypothetical protein
MFDVANGDKLFYDLSKQIWSCYICSGKEVVLQFFQWARSIVPRFRVSHRALNFFRPNPALIMTMFCQQSNGPPWSTFSQSLRKNTLSSKDVIYEGFDFLPPLQGSMQPSCHIPKSECWSRSSIEVFRRKIHLMPSLKIYVSSSKQASILVLYMARRISISS